MNVPPTVEPSIASSCLAWVEENIPDSDSVAPRSPGMKFLSFWPKWVTSAVSADRENVTELTPDEKLTTAAAEFVMEMKADFPCRNAGAISYPLCLPRRAKASAYVACFPAPPVNVETVPRSFSLICPATVDRWNVPPVGPTKAVNVMRSSQVEPDVECWTLATKFVTADEATTWRWPTPPPVEKPVTVDPAN